MRVLEAQRAKELRQLHRQRKHYVTSALQQPTDASDVTSAGQGQRRFTRIVVAADPMQGEDAAVTVFK